MHYLDEQEAVVEVGYVLRDRGWQLFGYHKD